MVSKLFKGFIFKIRFDIETASTAIFRNNQ